MILSTSRYSNPELKTGKYVAVGISAGNPRFALGYTVQKYIRELAPGNDLRKIDDYELFCKLYREQLDRLDIALLISHTFQDVPPNAHVVFLCFEDIRKEGIWCHRTIFAEWYEERTSEKIVELCDSSDVRYTAAEKKLRNENRLF